MVNELGVKLAMQMRMEKILSAYINTVVTCHMKVDVDDEFVKKYVEAANELYPEMGDVEVVYGTKMKLSKEIKKRINDTIKCMSIGITVMEEKTCR